MLFVDYQRRAFLHPLGNLRLTLDFAVKGSLFRRDLEEIGCSFPVMESSEGVLEIKYDSVFPTHVSSLLTDIPKISVAYSKFCKCREILV